MIKLFTKVISALTIVLLSFQTWALDPGTLVANMTVCYNADPGTTFSASPATNSCGGNVYLYQWLESTDNITFTEIAGASNVNYNIPASTVTKYYKRDVFDGCQTLETAVLTISVYDQLTAGTIGTSATVYCTGTVALTSSATAAGGPNSSLITYQWQKAEFSGGIWGAYSNISGATNTTYTDNALTMTSRYRRLATAAAPCGTQTANTNVVTITYSTALPATPASITSSTATYIFCPGTTGITFTAATVANANSYSWTFPTGVVPTSGVTSNVVTVDFDMTYAGGNITCAAVGNCGTGTARTRALTAASPLGTLGAITGLTARCPGNTQTYAVPSIAGATSYTWVLPTGVTGTSTTRTINTTFNGSFTGGTISVYATNACGNSTTSQANLTLNILAAPASISGTASQCPGNTGVVYTASTVSGATSYTWTLPTGVTQVSAVANQIIVNFGGSYTGGNLEVYAVNGCGNGATRTLALTLNPVCTWTWVGATSSLWNTASNWSTGTVPTTTSNVVIPSGTPNSPTVSSATANCNNITIDMGATLSVTNNQVLDVYGNLTNNGTLTTSGTSSSVRPRKASGSQTFSGDLSGIKYLLKLGAGTMFLGNSWTVTNGRVDLRAGAINTGGYALTFDINSGSYIGFTTGDAGSIVGNVTLSRSVGQFTHNLSSPLNGITAAEINDDFPVVGVNGNSRLFVWDVPTQAWVRQLTGVSTTLNRGQGYNFYCTTAGTLDFTGSYSQPATAFVTSGTADVAGDFILVGNPYIADINWDNITKSNVDATVYYWNQTAKAYATYTTGGASTNGGTLNVPVMQGFFVTATAAGAASVSIDRGDIANQAPGSTFFRSILDADKFNLKVTAASGLSDEIVILLADEASASFDGTMDAYKLMNPSSSLNLYTTLGGTDYSVNALPKVAGSQIIALNFKAPVDGSYTIKSSDISLLGVTAQLKDKKTGSLYDISTLDYTFDALKADGSDRFEIILGSTLTTSTRSAAATYGISFASSNKTVVIESASLVIPTATVELMDVSGRVITTTTSGIQVGNNFIPMENATPGMYVVKITDAATGKQYTGKVTLF